MGQRNSLTSMGNEPTITTIALPTELQGKKLAQSVEQRLFKSEIVGSIPSVDEDSHFLTSTTARLEIHGPTWHLNIHCKVNSQIHYL